LENNSLRPYSAEGASQLLMETDVCCGNTDQKHAQCKFKDSSCNNCGQMGHLQRVCTKEGKTTHTIKVITVYNLLQ